MPLGHLLTFSLLLILLLLLRLLLFFFMYQEWLNIKDLNISTMLTPSTNLYALLPTHKNRDLLSEQLFSWQLIWQSWIYKNKKVLTRKPKQYRDKVKYNVSIGDKIVIKWLYKYHFSKNMYKMENLKKGNKKNVQK